jgi:hypothetical protein
MSVRVLDQRDLLHLETLIFIVRLDVRLSACHIGFTSEDPGHPCDVYVRCVKQRIEKIRPRAVGLLQGISESLTDGKVGLPFCKSRFGHWDAVAAK